MEYRSANNRCNCVVTSLLTPVTLEKPNSKQPKLNMYNNMMVFTNRYWSHQIIESGQIMHGNPMLHIMHNLYNIITVNLCRILKK